MTVITPSRVHTPSPIPAGGALRGAQSSTISEPLQPRLHPPTALDNPAALKTAFGDCCDWQTLANHLRRIRQTFNDDSQAMGAELASRLKNTSMVVCEDSSYARQHGLTANNKVSLEAFFQDKGLSVPETPAELIQLISVVARKAQTPPLGNFAGALAWPVPLTAHERSVIAALLQDADSGLADPGKGGLGYLLSGSSVTDADLNVASRAMEKLLGSPKAQALGRAIESKLGGLPTDTSIMIT